MECHWWMESCSNWSWRLEDSPLQDLLIVDRPAARRWWQAARRPRRRTAARVARGRHRKGRHHHRESSFRPLSMARRRRAVVLLLPPPSSWTWLWTITEKWLELLVSFTLTPPPTVSHRQPSTLPVSSSIPFIMRSALLFFRQLRPSWLSLFLFFFYLIFSFLFFKL